MNITLLKRFRRKAKSKYTIEKEEYLYPRHVAKWMGDKVGSKNYDRIFVLRNGERITDKKGSYMEFQDVESARAYIKENIEWEIKCFITQERIKRAGIKQRKIIK